MKKKAIAVLLAVVLTAGSLVPVPAMAAEEALEEEAVTAETAAEAETAAAEEAETAAKAETAAEAETAAAEEAETAAEAETEAAAANETASSAASEIVEAAPAIAEENQAMSATSGTCGLNAAWKLTGSGSNLTLTITGSGTIDYYEEEKIPWASSKSKISKVVVGNGITNVSYCAFKDCTNLKSVTLPNSLTAIHADSFMNCTGLTNITIPSGVTMILSSAFEGCSSLTGITIPSGVTEIPLYAFKDCTSLTNVSLPDNLKSIKSGAFRNCTSLAGIKIPAGVTEIMNVAFSGCTSLKTIDLPAGLTKIPSSVFQSCSSLTSIRIPENVTEIDSLVFYHCSNLKTVTLPAGLTSIGHNAFSGCSSLAKIDLPAKLTKIDRYAFGACSSLTSVTIPVGVTEIKDYTFYKCTSLKSLKISHKVATIEEYAFSGCDALDEIVILDGTTDIHDRAFPFKMEEVDVYTIKGCAADQYFGSRGCSMHYFRDPAPGEKARILATEEVTVVAGKTANLFCIAYPYGEGGTAAFTFKSANSKVATVSKSGVVTGKAKGTTYVTVTKGSLSTTVDVSVKSQVVDLNSDRIGVELEKTVVDYNGSPATPAVTVKDNGQVLAEGTDYEVRYSYNGEVGRATVTVTGCGDYTGERRVYFVIRLGKTTKVNLTNVASGIKVDWKEVPGARCYKVYRRNTADSDSSYEFVFMTTRLYGTDKNVKPDNGTKYTYKVVASESKTSSLADSPVFRTGTGYRLIPVGIKSLTNSAAGRMTVTYDKNAKSSGYVVRFGLKSDMSDAKVITVKGAGTTSRTFSGLQKGKTYYVQVRTYKLEDGVRYYSGYCTTKTVKIVK